VTRPTVIYARSADNTASDAAGAAAAAGGDEPWPGLSAVATFFDREEDPGRDGLQRALAAIAGGEAETLFVDRLQDVATSLGALLRLVEWLDGHGGTLVAADVGFDSGARSGRRSLALVREIDRWGREGDDRRRPRGRPGLRARSPELAQRIVALRDSGLSLRAIADTLNADGVPTPRGGAGWRASSVQAALGYERPRPPAPGAPPPPPGPRGHGKGPGPGTPPKGPGAPGPGPGHGAEPEEGE
jgi:DNA invertase Pin-like site-specific DNA recombinase